MRGEGDTTEEYSRVQRREREGEREGASPRHGAEWSGVESDEERTHTDRERGTERPI